MSRRCVLFAGALAAVLAGCAGSPSAPEQPLTLEESASTMAQTVATEIADALEGTISVAAVTTPEAPLARLFALFAPRPAYANATQSSFTRNCRRGGSVRYSGVVASGGSYTMTNATATFTGCGYNPGRLPGTLNGALILNGRWCPGQSTCTHPSVSNPAMPVAISGSLDATDVGSVEFGGNIGRDAYTIPIGGVGLSHSGKPDLPPPPSPNTCPATLSPASVSAGTGGGTFTVSVTVGSTCPWTAASGSGFLTVTSGASGRGNGSMTFSVAANTGASRTGTLNVAGQNVTVSQAGAPLNVTGTWTATHSGSANSNGVGTAVLNQSGNSITGGIVGLSIPGATIVTNQLTGTISGTTATATLILSWQAPLPMGTATSTSTWRYTLTSISNTLISGTFTLTAVATVTGPGASTSTVTDAGNFTLTR